MKTINMIASTIQEFLGVFSNLAGGLNEGSLIFKDTMEQGERTVNHLSTALRYYITLRPERNAKAAVHQYG